MTHKYNIGDVVRLYAISQSERERIGIILKHRMWHEEIDYKILICGKPNEPIWAFERMIIERIYEVSDR